MAEKKINKVVYGNTVLIDLTADTITADKILVKYTAHDAAGNLITGTCDFDVNSQDATVAVAEIIEGKTAYARGTKLTGTMPNNAAVALTISDKDDEITIAQGYHDGSGKAVISATEKAKLVGANIKQGIEILGVMGTLEPSSSVKVTAKEFTPTKDGGTVLPGDGFDYITQVVVKPIPYVEIDNAAGGTTVTIA